MLNTDTDTSNDIRSLSYSQYISLLKYSHYYFTNSRETIKECGMQNSDLLKTINACIDGLNLRIDSKEISSTIPIHYFDEITELLKQLHLTIFNLSGNDEQIVNNILLGHYDFMSLRKNHHELASDLCNSILKLYSKLFQVRLIDFSEPNKSLNELQERIREANNKYKEIEHEQQKAVKISEELTALKDEAKATSDEIVSLVKEVVSGSNTTEFSKRSETVFWVAVFWAVIGILATVAIAVQFSNIVNTIDLSKSGEIAKLLLERTFYLVLNIFVIVFCAKQYNKERSLLEQYKFKSIALLSANLIKEIPNNKETQDAINLVILSQVLSRVEMDSSNKDDGNISIEQLLKVIEKGVEKIPGK